MGRPAYLFVLLIAAVVGGLALGRLDHPHFADADDPALVAAGARVYAANCAQCHGAHLEGQPGWQVIGADGIARAPPQNETGHSWMHNDEQLFRFVKYSMADVAPPGYVSAMPAFGAKLGDRDIVAVLAFIKSSWPIGVRAYQAMLNPNREGMPAAAASGHWHLPADCGAEPVRLVSDALAGKPTQ
jgi:mono/diheme cytochrome c family protein